MAFTVLPDGSITTDSVDEAVELALATLRRKHEPGINLIETKGPSPWRPNRPNGRGTIERSGRFGWRWSVMVRGKRSVGPTYRSRTEAEAALDKFVDTGVMPPKQPRAPYRCSRCSGDHTIKRCSNRAVGEPEPTSEPEMDIEASMTRREVQRRKCSACGEFDHKADKCPTVRKGPKVPKLSKKGARQGKKIEDEPVEVSISISAGDRFSVSEDFVDEETDVEWAAGDEWIAVSPTGKTLEGYDEWNMRQGTKKRKAYPQLHPFFFVVAGS